MSFLTDLITVLSSIKSDKIAVHEQRCISLRNRNAGCTRCMDVCTSGALSYKDNTAAVDSALCIGCGTCATACPSSAIEILSLSDEELTARIKAAIVATEGHPAIACQVAVDTSLGEGVDESLVCVVPCLGRVDESILIGAAAYKAKQVSLFCHDCGHCAHAPAKAMIDEVIKSSGSILTAFGSPLTIVLSEDIHALASSCNNADTVEEGLSRRDFFFLVKHRSVSVVREATEYQAGRSPQSAELPAGTPFEKVGRTGTLSQFVPSRRVRIYNYLRQLGKPVTKQVDSRIVGSLVIAEDRCNACRMCAVFCPTGAIKKLDDGKNFGIAHWPCACMQCRLCESLCPKEAIAVDSRVSVDTFLGKKAVMYQMERQAGSSNQASSSLEKLHALIGEDLEMCMF
jgi:MinD superfamily P-loop ATPase